MGAVEVTARPMAAPKLSSTKATAVAVKAPAIAGPHCTFVGSGFQGKPQVSLIAFALINLL